MTSVTADLAVARRHIELLTGSAETPINIRFIHDRDRSAAATTLFGTVDELWPAINVAQADHYGVFVVVNEGGNSDNEITGIRALFVDADDQRLPERWHLPPDFVVQRDDTHWHGYWRVTDCAVADFRHAQRRLIAHYKSDPKIINESRIMRLAGTVWQKGMPTVVDLLDDARVEGWELGRTLAEVTEGLPEVAPEREALTDAPPGITIDEPANVSRARQRLLALVAAGDVAIELQGGNDRTLKVACELTRDLALSVDTAFDLINEIWNPACQPEWEEAELRQIVENSLRYGKNAIGARAVTSTSLAETFPQAVTNLPALAEAPSIVTPDGPGIIMRHLTDWRLQNPTRWLIDGFIPDGETVLIHAPMGRFKSFVVGDLALAIASGKPAFGNLAVKRTGPVVYFLGEGRKAFEMQRTEAWFKDRGFTPPRDFPLATVQGLPLLADRSHVEACIAAIDREFGNRQGGLIVLDPYTRSIPGLDENGSDTASLAIQLVEELKERFRCSVILVAHEGLDAGRARGSTALSAGFDNVWSMKREDGSLAVEIKPVRLKDGPEDKSIFLQGRKVLAPVDGERPETLVFDLIDASDFRKANGKGGITSQDVRAAIKKLADVGTDPITTAILASELWGANPTGPSADSIRTQLDRNKGSRFPMYVRHAGSRGDPTTWHLPTTEDERNDDL